MNKSQCVRVSQSAKPCRRSWESAGLITLWLGLCLGAGCSSPGKPASNPLAYVVIHGQSHQKVADTAAAVFHEHGYQVTRNGWEHLIFEKPGSTMNNVAYRNWAEGPVWVRVKLSVVDTAPGTSTLECEAFVLRSRNEPTEEEIRITKLHSHKYKELLQEVAKRLSTHQPAASGS